MRRGEFFSGSTNIRVIGVGGGGSNAVNRMIRSGIQGVEFIVANTDTAALAQSQASIRIPLGVHLTNGRSTGGDIALGERAAYESLDELREVIEGADMLFLASGLGGGTGTGATPVIAELAQEMGILTIAIVTRPFSFEGGKRAKVAAASLDKLQTHTNTLIAIPNDRLLGLVNERTSLDTAFRLADDVLCQGIQVISDLITVPGLINLDFADVKAVMSTPGGALMTVGQGKGKGRARKAAEQAIRSPLLDMTITGARSLLVNVTTGPDVSLQEVNEAVGHIRDTAHPGANLIFGAVIDAEMGPEMRITVVAKGFEPPHTQSRPAFQPEVKRVRMPAFRQRPEPAMVPAPPRISLRDFSVPTFLRSR